MGDPAGIGPDITLSAWMEASARSLSPFVVFGDPLVLISRARRLGMSVPIVTVSTTAEGFAAFDRALPVINTGASGDPQPGLPTASQAKSTINAIDRAVQVVMDGSARAVVTNPIAKSVLYLAGFGFPGHTEYLAHLAVAMHPDAPTIRPVMMLAASALKVVPTTIHVPLIDVPGLLTQELITQTILITAAALTRDFQIKSPRIAVAGLNPHAGEQGTIGTEDRDVILPAIQALQALGLDVTGPHSADTLFHAAARARYDVAVAMYHDQALIPIKTLAFDTGVNVTLGLPFVRTSPDHGTAYDIAGTGTASPESLIQALLLADRMARNRLLDKAH